MFKKIFVGLAVLLSASGCAKYSDVDLTNTRATDDISDRPELGTAVSGDSILAVNAGNAAGSRLSRILFDAVATHYLSGDGRLLTATDLIGQDVSTAGSPSFVSVTAGQFISSAADGNRYGDVSNSVALNTDNAVIVGRYGWYNGRMRIADGDDWTTLSFLMNSDVDDTPVNGDVLSPISSNYVYDHVAAADPHTGYSLESDIDDTPVNGEVAAPISSNWAYDHGAAADPHTGYVLESALGAGVGTILAATPNGTGGVATPDGTKTLTNTSIDYAGTGNNITVPFNEPIWWFTPGDADDPIIFSEGLARTLGGMMCICSGGGTISVDLQECATTTKTGCTTTGATFTCGSTKTSDSSLTDTSIASNAIVVIAVGAPTGTVSEIFCQVWGTEIW